MQSHSKQRQQRPNQRPLTVSSQWARGAGLPRGFHALLAAQFFSALADNALLIVSIALLIQQGFAAWWAPLLKVGFNAAYVITAPFVGALADSLAKGRLMAAMNALKMVGAVALLLGLHPVAALAVVGLGAAAYAPAKYGLVTELLAPERLVAGNGWLEVSVVCAVLLGTACGGLLVSPVWLQLNAAAPGGALAMSVCVVLGLYGVAALINRAVPDSGARYGASNFRPRALVRDYLNDHRALWRDPEGGISLAVTTLFWGVAATLQFVVLRWSGEALGLTLDRGAYLQAAVAVGVVAGAAAAGRCVALAQARRLLPLGVVLGAMLPLMLWAGDVASAAMVLIAIGAVGGFLLVPMNAWLQHRGCTLLSAGRSIAVQGFNENLSVLLLLGTYAALVALDTPIHTLVWGFGLAVAAGMAVIAWQAQRSGVAPRAFMRPGAARGGPGR